MNILLNCAAARLRRHLYRLVRPVTATLSARRCTGREGSRKKSEVRRSPGPLFLSGCGEDAGPVGHAVVRFFERAGLATQ